MARPRSVSNQAILKAAWELVTKEGPGKLTFERLGAQVGLVPTALVRRFRNKKQLFAAVDRFALELTDKKVNEAMKKTSSPIEAIIVQFVTELSFASTIERFANGQEFLLMDFREKELYANYQMSFQCRHMQVVDLLKKAESAGELSGISDHDRLARHLELLLHGAGHVWVMSQDKSIEEYITDHVELALQPYRT